MSKLSTAERIHALDFMEGFTAEQWAQWFAQDNIETTNSLHGFSVGDYVTFTNDYGCEFKGYQIKAITVKNQIDSSEADPYHFYLNTDAFWSPHSLSSLSKADNCVNYFIDREVSRLFKDMGAFYAFGGEQFNAKKKAGVKYCEILGGLCCPIENRDNLLKAFLGLHDEGRKKRMEAFSLEAIIQYELANHECWYTGSIPKDTIEDLIEDYGATKEMIYKVFSEGWAKYD
jgi:hypothetical protein